MQGRGKRERETFIFTALGNYQMLLQQERDSLTA